MDVMTKIGPALEMMGQGMLGIFAVLGIIALMVAFLKKLDNKAKLPATIFTYSCGIVSALVFGTGMCMAMQVIGGGMVLGILIGIIGLIGCGVNYPTYKKMLEKGKSKYAFEIVQLAKEIADN